MGKLGVTFTAILLFGMISCILDHVYAEPLEDKQALLDFLLRMPHSRLLNWAPNTQCCSWIGITCNADRTRVVALRLPGVGLSGSIPSNTLGRLSALQTLSLRKNRISGPFPSDFTKLGNLTSLYLQYNKLHGALPLDLSVWQNLVVLNLSNNEFNGTIPPSISNVTHLTTLDLSSNSLLGQIPNFNLPNLQFLNLSNNHLNGTLPHSLLRYPSSAFFGNNISSEVSIPPLPSPLPPSSQSHSSNRFSESALLGIVLSSCAIGFMMIALLMLFCCSNKERDRNDGLKPRKGKTTKKKKRVPTETQEERDGRITFFEGSTLAFDLEDLLRASAEVLGKGTFGTTYKAALEDSTTVVVKRLKEVSVGKRDFEQLMEVVGNLRHENVAALRAYYYSKEEKLMVYDYFSRGSLSTLLHGKRGQNRAPLDWETRLKIVIGAARGIAHIHTQNGGKLVHGNIKSSNIFLNSENYGCVSDLGLATIVTPLAPPIQRIIGYRAPEVSDPRKATQACDVYSFGVLVLELLTGKTPLGEGIHLVRWVNSVVREEWTAEVFDVELLRHPNIEEEMVTMLQLGMTCADRVPDRRPKMSDVVQMVEDIRRGDSRIGTGTYPSSEVSTPTLASLSHLVEVGSVSGTPQ
ncbi:hypothetical protein Cgig2_005067 [Carnegiea gigantea]|uniref:Protein kinase domain-containing protein n=1 Tax=Carnegiea gigantea TaxID=171969 RepID=A0A9Q1QT96_9CARY|nr:hypothetical protein Cgig2_005067 [Carnegiea gigantea]